MALRDIIGDLSMAVRDIIGDLGMTVRDGGLSMARDIIGDQYGRHHCDLGMTVRDYR